MGAGRWQGDHHDGVPIFVMTHDVPDDPPPGSVRYVTDVHECASQARVAAGDGDVMVPGELSYHDPRLTTSPVS